MNGEGPDSIAIPLSRRYTVLLVILALVLDPFALFGMLALSTTGFVGTVLALVGSGLVAVVTLQFLIQLAMPAWFGLRLDSQGFTVRMNLGSRRYRWDDVEQFSLYHTVALYPVVVFKYRGKAEVHGIQYTRGLLGSFDGSLPQNLPLRGRPLLDLMEQWRLRSPQRGVISQQR
jgi:hypothetical protein